MLFDFGVELLDEIVELFNDLFISQEVVFVFAYLCDWKCTYSNSFSVSFYSYFTRRLSFY
jgi:hypothetical protein